MARARVLTSAGRIGESAHACTAALALQSKLDPHDPGLAANRQACDAFKAGRKPW
jgi:hypothetical protein